MSALFARVRDLYLAPGPAPATPRVRSLAPAPAAAVLGRPADAPALAAVLALSLARSGGWPVAVVAAWRAGEGTVWRLPGRPAARRLAARLSADGSDAHASGRLVHVRVPDGVAQAVVAAERATAAVRGPVAIALCGPRTDEVDALLRLQDVLVLAVRPGDDPALARMAAGSLSGLRAPVVTCEAAAGALGRGIAASGLRSPVGLRRALAPALEVAR